MRLFSFRPLLLTALYLGVVMLLTLEGSAYVRNWSLQRLQAQGAERLLGNITQLRSALDQYRYLPFVLTQSREVRALLRAPQGQGDAVVNRYLEQIALVAGSSALLVLDLNGMLRASSNWRDQRALQAHSQGESALFPPGVGRRGGAPVRAGGGTSAAIALPVGADL